ncbi:MAG: TonB-dependent receptor [Salibacteraceae bacterium]
MKKFLLVTWLLLPFLVFAQPEENVTQTISGNVIDNVSQFGLPGATVIVLGSNPIIGATTDIDGNFELNDVPIGRVNLEFSFIGFEKLIKYNIPVVAGKELFITAELKEIAFEMEEFVVTNKHNKEEAINSMATASARTFSIEETERFAGSLGDPSRMASNFAGVSMVNDSRNDIIIRGNSPIGLLWRLDGFEIPNPNHFGAMGTTGGPVSMLNNNLLTNSDFFTGAFPAEYGNAMSGVFDLKMRSGNTNKHEFLGQIGFNGFELGAEGPISKKSNSSYMVNYRYSTLGLMNKMGFNFGTGTSIPQYQDFTAKIDLPTKKLGKFSLLTMLGDSYIELHDSETATENSGEDSGFDLAGADVDFGSKMRFIGLSNIYYFSQNTRLQTNVSVTNTKNTTYIDSLLFDTNGNIIPNSNYKYYEQFSEETKFAFATSLRHKINARNNFVLGGNFDFYDINYHDSILQNNNDSSWFISNYGAEGIINVPRIFFQWQYLASPKLVINPGIYFQYDFKGKELSIEPRLGIKYKLNNTQSFSLAYGKHSQTQPRFYYFLQDQQPDGSFQQTNKDMELSKSQQIVLGYDLKIKNSARLKVESYYQYLFNIPVTGNLPEFSMINTGDSFTGVYPSDLENSGTGENYGIEFSLEKFLKNNYYFLATLSLFESKYADYDNLTRNTAFNGNFASTVLGGYEYEFSKQYSITADARVVYAGGKRYVPINLEESKQENKTVYDWENAYENKYDNYFRTDLRIGFKMNGKKYSQEWAIDLQNLTNSQNIYSQSYNPRTQGLSTKYQTGFYPMFLYRIRF